MNSYKDLKVWQKSVVLCTEIYKVTKNFPSSEIYSITSQIRRSSVSIPSNIAEGNCRGHREYIQFLKIAFGSGGELETQLIVSLNIGYLNQKKFKHLNALLEEIMKMLNGLISSLVFSSP
jgi:four helix bundle protein